MVNRSLTQISQSLYNCSMLLCLHVWNFFRYRRKSESNRSGVHGFEWHRAHGNVKRRGWSEWGDTISRILGKSTVVDAKRHRTSSATSRLRHSDCCKPDGSRTNHGRQFHACVMGDDQRACRDFVYPSRGHHYCRHFYRSCKRSNAASRAPTPHDADYNSCSFFQQRYQYSAKYYSSQRRATTRCENIECHLQCSCSLCECSCTRRSCDTESPRTLFTWGASTCHQECKRQSVGAIQLFPKTRRSRRLYCRSGFFSPFNSVM